MDFVRQSHLYHHLPYRMPLSQYRLSYPLVPTARCTCECYCMGSQRPRFDVMEKAAASGFELSGADSKHLEAGMENDVFNPDKSGRRNRTTYKRWQIDELERAFVMNPYPTSVFKKTLAMRLGLRDSRVQVWFQNRRAKSKRETKGPRDSFNNENVNDTDFHTDHALLYNEALTEQLHINVTEPSD